MRKIGVVAMVLAGLIIVAQGLALTSFPISILTWRGNTSIQRGFLLALSLLPAFLVLAMGVYLIGKRHRLAEKWFSDSLLDISLAAIPLLRLGLILAGIWLIVARAIPYMLTVASRAISQFSQLTPGFPMTLSSAIWNLALETLVGLLQIGLGLLVVAYSQSLAERLWVGRRAEAPSTQPALPRCPSCGTPFNPTDYRPDAESPKCSACGGLLNIAGGSLTMDH